MTSTASSEQMLNSFGPIRTTSPYLLCSSLTTFGIPPPAEWYIYQNFDRAASVGPGKLRMGDRKRRYTEIDVKSVTMNDVEATLVSRSELQSEWSVRSRDANRVRTDVKAAVITRRTSGSCLLHITCTTYADVRMRRTTATTTDKTYQRGCSSPDEYIHGGIHLTEKRVQRRREHHNCSCLTQRCCTSWRRCLGGGGEGRSWERLLSLIVVSTLQSS